jgi:hypothetical protein
MDCDCAWDAAVAVKVAATCTPQNQSQCMQPPNGPPRAGANKPHSQAPHGVAPAPRGHHLCAYTSRLPLLSVVLGHLTPPLPPLRWQLGQGPGRGPLPLQWRHAGWRAAPGRLPPTRAGSVAPRGTRAPAVGTEASGTPPQWPGTRGTGRGGRAGDWQQPSVGITGRCGDGGER